MLHSWQLIMYRTSNFSVKSIGISVFVLLLCILTASIIVNEDIIKLNLLTGLLISILLFCKPTIALWLVLILTFLVSGTVSYFLPYLTTIRWGVVILSLILGVRSVLELVVPTSNQSDINHMSKLTKAMIALVIIISLSLLLNRPPLLQILSSTKNFFQFWPIFIAFLLLPLKSKTTHNIFRFLFFVAIFQLPIAFLQQILVVPYKSLLTGMKGGELGDAVVGTFGGGMLTGGSSSFLSLFMILMIGSLLSLARYGQITWNRSLWFSTLFLVPLIFNETKITFVYFFVMILVVFWETIYKKPSIFFISITLSFFIIAGMGFCYIKLYSGSSGWTSYLANTISYNFGSSGYGQYELNRSNVLTFWFQKQDIKQLTHGLFGYGLGSAQEASEFMPAGKIESRYNMLGIGLTMASRLLWDIGIVGLLVYLGIFLSAYISLINIEKSKFLFDDEKAFVLSLKVGIILFFISTFYRLDYLDFQSANAAQMLILSLTLLLEKTEFLRKHAKSVNSINI